MPRPQTAKNRWTIIRFPGCYCFERDGRVHTNVYGVRKAIKPQLAWHKDNKEIALSILHNRISEYYSNKKEDKHNNLTNLLNIYADTHFTNYSKETIKKYKQAINTLISNNVLLSEQNEIRSMVMDNLNKSNWSINTKRKHLSLLQAIFNYAIDIQLIDKNPIIKSLFPKEQKFVIIAFTRNEVDAIENYYKSSNLEMSLLIKFIGITGVRISEALSLTWDRIYFDNSKIVILGKGNAEREIPMFFEGLKECLIELKSISENGKVFKWKRQDYPNDLLNKAKNDLNIDKKVSFHGIRKMRENELILKYKNDPTIVARILGHTPAQQSKHYLLVLGAEEMEKIMGNYPKS